MSNETILTSDVLDIIFEKRNKAYGAYMLRKFYPNRIKTSLLVMFALAIIFSAFTFLPDKKTTGEFTFKDEGFTVVQLQVKQDPPKVQSQTVVTKSQQKFLSSILFVPEKDTSDRLRNITNIEIGNKTIISTISTSGTGNFIPADASDGTAAVAPLVPAPVITNENPFENPDVQAMFPGGEKELFRFLQKNLHAPEDLEAAQMVEVKVKFVVGFDGNLQTFTITKDGGPAFNNEVIRVLKKMPKWNPGKKGGQNVPVYYSIPVKFTAAE